MVQNESNSTKQIEFNETNLTMTLSSLEKDLEDIVRRYSIVKMVSIKRMIVKIIVT